VLTTGGELKVGLEGVIVGMTGGVTADVGAGMTGVIGETGGVTGVIAGGATGVTAVTGGAVGTVDGSSSVAGLPGGVEWSLPNHLLGVASTSR